MSDQGVIKKTSLSPTVLIVGGAGFIGSHLAEALLANNARVIVVDNFSTGKDIYVNSLLNNPKFALFNADVNIGLPKEIESVDYVFHMAGLETYLFDKTFINLDSLLTNAIGTKNILDFSRKAEARFLLASSTDVYKGLISPVDLDHYFGPTQEEEKKYSLTEAKRYAEALVWEYYKKYSSDVRIVRVPEVYGPRMNLEASGNLGSLLKSLLENKDLIVYGDGVEKEFYLYISDAVAGMVRALFNSHTEGKIFTLVPKSSHTVLEITYAVKSLADAEPRVVFKSKSKVIKPRGPREHDTTNLQEIQWEPKVELKEGLVKTLEWFGYKPNPNAFKPAKLIEQKNSEQKNFVRAEIPAVMSIVDETPPAPPPPDTTPKVEDEVLLPAKPPTLKRELPSLHLPKFPKREKRAKHFAQKAAPAVHLPAETGERSKKVVWKLVLANIFIASLAALVFIVVPLIQTYVHARKGVNNLRSVETSLIQLQSGKAQELSNEAFREFYKAQTSLKNLSWLFRVTGQQEIFHDVQRILSSASYASKSVYYLSKGSLPFVQFWDTVKPHSQIPFDEEAFKASKSDFLNAKDNLKFAEADLSQVDFEKLPAEMKEYKDTVTHLSSQIEILTGLSEGLPDLVGLDREKTYLILFQNSNELRPTGGFIGSYATLRLKDGRITDLQIDDIYNPDGQIDVRGIEVEPPAPIKTFLQEEYLHIRNANWDPDFPTSAKTIEELFYRVNGQRVDGILAVDLHFIEDILKVTGPVSLVAYNEDINAENVYERAQFHSEFNYENGSDQKKSFLTVLGGKMLETLFDLENEKVYRLAMEIQSSMDEKHVIAHIPNNNINVFLEDRGWNGKLMVPEQSDYLYVVNANVGGTKANYYVEPSMNYQIVSATRDGVLRSELLLTYEHTGEDSSWPGGPYTNYLRVLTTSGTKLTGAKVEFSDGRVQDVFEEVVKEDSILHTSYGLGFVLQPKQTAQIKITYDLPEHLILTRDNLDYKLYWQKQPGTRSDNIMFKFNAPFGTKIIKAAPQLQLGEGSAELNGVLNKDLKIDLDLE